MTVKRRWRKVSASGPNGNCVLLPHTMDAVGDSKNGAVLEVGAHVSTLLRFAKEGRLNSTR